MENIENKNLEVDVEGRTIEEAVKKAALILKVPAEQLCVKVLSEEQKGLFGMPGAKQAKIRASIKSHSSEKKNS